MLRGAEGGLYLAAEAVAWLRSWAAAYEQATPETPRDMTTATTGRRAPADRPEDANLMGSTAKEQKPEKSKDAAAAEVDDTSKEKPREKKSAKIKYESVLPREEAVSYFEAIVAGMKKGTIQLKQGDESVILKPADRVAVEVKGSQKGDTERISFELVWRHTSGSDLKISSN